MKCKQPSTSERKFPLFQWVTITTGTRQDALPVKKVLKNYCAPYLLCVESSFLFVGGVVNFLRLVLVCYGALNGR